MADSYSIDLTGCLDLAARTAQRLDDLADGVRSMLLAVSEIQDAAAPVPDLARALSRALDPWIERATALAEHGGAVLTAAENAVLEYCRADAAMAVDTDRAARASGWRGHTRWSVS